jgi:hypothetical protein
MHDQLTFGMKMEHKFSAFFQKKMKRRKFCARKQKRTFSFGKSGNGTVFFRGTDVETKFYF